MKKNVFILTCFLLFFGMFFALPLFNDLSSSRINSYMRAYRSQMHEISAIQIENSGDLLLVDSDRYNEILNKYAVKNNIVLSKFIFEDDSLSGQKITKLYLTTNDLYLKEWLLLDSNYAKKISKDIVYSTVSKNRNHKIANFNLEYIIEVTSVENDISGGSYMIYNLSGNLENNITQFIQDLKSELGDINYRQNTQFLQYFTTEGDLSLMDSLFYNFNFKLILVSILVLISCSKIFSISKFITVMKIEGYSSLKIYLNTFFYPFMNNVFFLTIFLCIGLFALYFGNVQTYVILLQLILSQYIQLLVITLILSLILILIIKNMPVYESIKGKDKLKDVQCVAYLIKILVVTIIVPLVYSSFTDLNAYIQATLNYKNSYTRLEGLYTFGFYKESSLYHLDLGTENYIAVEQELVKNNQLFSFGSGFFLEDVTAFDPNNTDDYYYIDKNFIQQNKLLDNSKFLDNIIIFVTEHTKDSKEELKRKALTNVRDIDGYEVQFVELNKPIHTIDFYELLFQDEINYSLPIVYTPIEEGLEGQLNQTIFHFDGSVSEAEKYVDSIFHKYGYAGAYQINSLQLSFSYYYQSMISQFIEGALVFIALVLAYYFTNRFLVEVDIDNNKKRYIISFIEGVEPYSVLLYLLKIASPSFIALLICILSRRIHLDCSIVYVGLFISLMEIVLYVLFKLKYRKVKREL